MSWYSLKVLSYRYVNTEQTTDMRVFGVLDRCRQLSNHFLVQIKPYKQTFNIIYTSAQMMIWLLIVLISLARVDNWRFNIQVNS